MRGRVVPPLIAPFYRQCVHRKIGIAKTPAQPPTCQRETASEGWISCRILSVRLSLIM